MGQSVIAVTEPAPAVPVVSVSTVGVCRDLLELLAGVSDGRSSRGRDHPAAVVLALAAAATVAGMRGYTAIAGWVADVPADVLADLYVRVGAVPVGPPSKATIWRVCTDVDPQALDSAVGTWLGSHLASYTAEASCVGGAGGDEQPDTPQHVKVQVRLDGKIIRRAKDADGNQVHLLAALAGPADDSGASVVVTQAEVTGAKTNEPQAARQVLGRLDLHGTLVTADALHTVKVGDDVAGRGEDRRVGAGGS